MRRQESVPAPRGRTFGAAWEGTVASLLLHLFVGAAVIVALSGPPGRAPQVVDLTLLPPAEIARSPVPPAFAAAEPARDAGTATLEVPPTLVAPPTVANTPPVTTPVTPSDTPGKRIAAASGSPHLPAAAQATTVRSPVKATAWIPSGTPGAGSPAGDFAWIRDAIQHAIAYPPAARKMGWEGKVVVAFQLLADGSVRDVRVVQGSGHVSLDRGAIDAVRNASPFPRSPVEAEVITPIVYRLTSR
jgi:TonB family protein